MNFEIEWTRENLRDELIKKRTKVNIIFLIIGILLYIWFMYGGIKSELFDNVIILIGGILFVSFLAFALYILTHIYIVVSLKKNDRNTNKAYGIYKITLTDEEIIVKINNDIINYAYKDIIKFRKKKHSFFIKTKEDKIGLIFKDSMFSNDDYHKLLSFIKNKLSC